MFQDSGGQHTWSNKKTIHKQGNKQKKERQRNQISWKISHECRVVSFFIALLSSSSTVSNTCRLCHVSMLSPGLLRNNEFACHPTIAEWQRKKNQRAQNISPSLFQPPQEMQVLGSSSFGVKCFTFSGCAASSGTLALLSFSRVLSTVNCTAARAGVLRR